VAPSHTDREYSEHLDLLNAKLRRMGDLVQEMIVDAVSALADGDQHRARTTIQRDKAVNRLEIEVDELCILILARWQPVASDLRFITAALKLVTDVERIGDLAANICERAIDVSGRECGWDMDAFRSMATFTQRMVGDAAQAFVSRDADLARAVIARDDEADQLYHTTLQGVIERMKASSDCIADGVHVQAVAKWLERIADHATNIAEQTIFLVAGQDVRHAPP
jgi:phosphate transport system protein